MSRLVSELRDVLSRLLAEHEGLYAAVEAHLAAMRKLDVQGMDRSARQQAAARLRINQLEQRRRLLVQQTQAALRLGGPPALSAIAQAVPDQAAALLDLRDRLRNAAARISRASAISARLAGAIMGHLNTVVRLVAGAVEQAGLYTRSGNPQVSGSIGIMEAVG